MSNIVKWHDAKMCPAYNTYKILIADADNAEVVMGYYRERTDTYHRFSDDKQINAAAWTELPVFNFKSLLV